MGRLFGFLFSPAVYAALGTLALALLFWPLIDKAIAGLGQLRRPAKAGA